jgi:pyruvate formate lyase activating enzyme
MSMDPASSPVFGILQNASMVDYPGKMAAVFFISGCNFRCGFCHNAPLMGNVNAPTMRWTDVEEACQKFRDNWVESVVVTGGEPTLHPNVFQIVEKLREWNFGVKLDTNGSRPDVLEKLLPMVDYVAMDVKFAPKDYPERAGFADVDRITESIALLRERAKGYEFRTTVIQAWHDEDQMRAIGQWVQGAKLHVLQAFVPRDNLPDPVCRKMPETAADHMHALADVLRHYVHRVEVRGEF